MSASETLRWLVTALESAEIPYMLVGSFASSVHGQSRTTRDLDVVIDPTPSAFERFVSSIETERFYFDLDVARDALRRRGMFNIIDSSSGWKIDLVVRKATPHAIAELARRVPGNVLGVGVFLASAEDVIIAKLGWAKLAGSERQLDDVRGILVTTGARLDREYIDDWVENLGLTETWARAVGSSAAG